MSGASQEKASCACRATAAPAPGGPLAKARRVAGCGFSGHPLKTASLLLLALALGCADEGGSLPGDLLEARSPVADAAATRAGDSCRGCAPPAGGVVLVSALEFAEQGPDGVADGFDLDGRVSDKSDPTGCGQADFTAPDGTPGIDNQIAQLAPALQAVGAGAAEDLIQESIKSGGLLILMELLPDPADPGRYTLVMRRGAGKPLLGADGALQAWQTFSIGEDPELGSFRGVTVADGVGLAGPAPVRVPFFVFGFFFEIAIPEAYIRFEVDSGGRIERGILGGGVPLEVLFKLTDNINDSSVPAVVNLIKFFADLAPDAQGKCTALSAALVFEGIPAFVLP